MSNTTCRPWKIGRRQATALLLSLLLGLLIAMPCKAAHAVAGNAKRFSIEIALNESVNGHIESAPRDFACYLSKDTAALRGLLSRGAARYPNAGAVVPDGSGTRFAGMYVFDKKFTESKTAGNVVRLWHGDLEDGLEFKVTGNYQGATLTISGEGDALVSDDWNNALSKTYVRANGFDDFIEQDSTTDYRHYYLRYECLTLADLVTNVVVEEGITGLDDDIKAFVLQREHSCPEGLLDAEPQEPDPSPEDEWKLVFSGSAGPSSTFTVFESTSETAGNRVVFEGSGAIEKTDDWIHARFGSVGRVPVSINWYRPTELEFEGDFSSIGENVFNGIESLTSVQLPEGLASIEAYAFCNCKNLQYVGLPEGLRTIGRYAFVRDALAQIEIPNSVSYIGECAFEDNPLSMAVIAGDNLSIGKRAFAGCDLSDGVVFERGVAAIGEEAFSGCGMTDVSLPSTVTSIGVKAFYACKELEYLSLGSRLETVGEMAFALCESLQEVTLPASINVIGNQVFSYCEGLNEVTIRCNPSEAGWSVFESCTSLESASFSSGVTKTWDGMFRRCTGLTSVRLPASLETIAKNSFEGCTGLRSISLPAALRDIGCEAFVGCASLKTPSFPAGLRRIQERAFEGCASITEVRLPEGISSLQFGAFFGCPSLSRVHIPASLEDPTCDLADAFGTPIQQLTFGEGCTTIRSCYGANPRVAVLPEGVTTIDEEAFQGCTALKSLELPPALVSIGDSAFAGCKSLSTVKFPPALASIGDSAFEGCTSLATLTIPANVRSIGDKAFSYCTSIKKIVVEEGVSSIGNEAFYGCSAVKEMSLPASLKEVDLESYFGFFDSTRHGGEGSIAEFTLPRISFSFAKGLKVSAYGVFSSTSTRIEKVVIPGTWKTVPEGLLFLTSNVDSVVLQSGVTAIARNAFAESGIKKVTLPTTLEKIDREAFCGCEKLKNVKLPSSLTSIGDSAFARAGLTSITIPGSIRTIGTAAFVNCESLASVTVKEGVVSLGQEAFADCDKLKTVHLPGSLKSLGFESLYCQTLKDVYIGTDEVSFRKATGSTYTGSDRRRIYGVIFGEDYAYYGVRPNPVLHFSKKQMTNAAVAKVKAQAYTGKAIKPKPKVTYAGTVLKLDRDYTLSYKNNKNTGTATVVIKGKGSYTGSKSVSFAIKNKKAKSLSGAKIASIKAQTFTGTAIQPVPKVKLGDKTLKRGQDYRLSYKNNAKAGSATVVVTGMNAYKGTVTKTFKIVGNITKAKVSISGGAQSYTGKTITPSVSVKLGSTTLKAGTDYTLSYTNNKKVGTATVTVKGKGSYKGSRSATFTIRYNLAKATVTLPSGVYDYTGSAIMPKPEVEIAGTKLVEGTDYVVSHANNVSVGTATVKVQAKGDSVGSKSASYAIAYNLSEATVTLDRGQEDYTGEEVRPACVVKVAGTELAEGSDYTLAWSNNVLPGKAELEVMAGGTSHGSAHAEFDVIGDLAQAEVTLPDEAYESVYEGTPLAPEPVVVFAGTTLTRGQDYDVTYLNNDEPGYALATVSGKGFFCGSQTLTFAIAERSNQGDPDPGTNPDVEPEPQPDKRDISSATVELSAKEYAYTGDSVVPDLSVTLEGVSLRENVDYVATYENNVAVGTATLVVTGIGNYTGGLTTTFEIVGTVHKVTLRGAPVGKIGETLQLSADIEADPGADETLVWSSSDESVVTVTQEGTATLLAEGSASIHVRASSGAADTIAIVAGRYNEAGGGLGTLRDGSEGTSAEDYDLVDTTSWRDSSGAEKYYQPADREGLLWVVHPIDDELCAAAKSVELKLYSRETGELVYTREASNRYVGSQCGVSEIGAALEGISGDYAISCRLMQTSDKALISTSFCLSL